MCPATEVSRYSAESLADEESDGPADDGSDGSADGDSDAESSDDGDEPRVYEETEGTPTVSRGGAPAADAADTDDGGGVAMISVSKLLCGSTPRATGSATTRADGSKETADHGG
ncbi:hypothetical protein BN903_2 [Halorubrum sp. AJ67]|nr:hypothetical protein BN903_2 [Halorubrum sp. AJ67]